MTANPKRIQLSRKKGFRLPPNAVNVARPGKYGNPHRVGLCPKCGVEHSREEAVALFADDIDGFPRFEFDALRGKDLACWCKATEKCHADVLLDMANR